ncbi:MAG: winged helix-turn-helix transcriptional regulator [Phycisphaerales bacterium]|nr:winged helix-turn-helix transcriptional regulator [Phycisphaerales bacterium]
MATLAAELGKRRPFDLPEEEAYLSIVRTGVVLQCQHARLFRAYDLTPASYNILRILRGAGAEGRCASEIASQVVTEVPDMTRLVDRLENLGLLERHREDIDRRKIRIRISEKGLTTLAELDAPVRDLLRQQFAGVAADDQQRLIGQLAALRNAVRTRTTDSSTRKANSDHPRSTS